LLCHRCGIEIENFIHIWLCEEAQDDLYNLIYYSKDWIQTYLTENYPNFSQLNDIIDDIWELDMWDIAYSGNDLTIIDLIKGIIPLELPDKVLQVQ